MTFLDLLALFFGVLGVLLTIKEALLGWIAGIVSVCIQAYVFFKVRLYGDFSLQIFYFIAGVYGWSYWNKKNKKEFEITNISKKNCFFIAIGNIVLCLMLYPILNHFKTDKIIFECILTSSSLICTYMMTKKWIENWLFWILIDLGYAYLYIIKELTAFAILYLFFSILALNGYYRWEKKLKRLSY